MAEIVVLNGACAGTVFVLPEIPTVIGRSPESHLQILDPWISSMHALFERRGGEIWVVDLDSRNGTFVGEERVQEAQVPDGAVVRFGRTECRFERTRSTGPVAPPESRPARDLQRDTLRDGTLSTRDPRIPREPEEDPYALALRPATVLRMAIDSVGIEGLPDAPERLRVAVDSAARAAAEAGGVVARLAGVGILALFGLANPTPQDASRALAAARAARLAVRATGGLDLRAGVDAGVVLAGNASGPSGFDLGALGPAAERAERLLSLAGPGEILAGPGAAASEGLVRLGLRPLGGDEVEVFRDEGR